MAMLGDAADCVADGQVQKMSPLTRLQVALKTSNGISYFDCDVPSHCLWHENSKLGVLIASILAACLTGMCRAY